jgi:outer membrane protein assembly factor BamB
MRKFMSLGLVLLIMGLSLINTGISNAVSKNIISSFGWVQSFPDSRGNTYINVTMPEGKPQIAWSNELKYATAPIVSGESIFMGVGSTAVCWDLLTGDRKWVKSVPGTILAPPVLTASRVIFCDDTGSVLSMDMKTGEIMNKWGEGFRIEAPPVIVKGGQGDVLIASTSGYLHRLTPDLREVFSTDIGAPLFTSPIITSKGIIQLASNGKLATLDPKTGKINSRIITIAQNGALQPCQNSGLVNLTIGSQVLRLKGEEEFKVDIKSMASVQTSLPTGELIVGAQKGLMLIDSVEKKWEVETKDEVTALSANDTIVFFGTSDGEHGAVEIETGKVLWRDYTAGKVRHPIVLLESGILMSTGYGLSYRQLWSLHPEPDEIDFGHVPTGEITSKTFSMENPSDSPGIINVIARSESELITVEPSEVNIAPGETAVFTVYLESQGIKEGRFYTTVVLETPTSSYHVSISYYIVPQPFIANIQIDNDIMKMKRGTATWDVKLDHPPYIKNDRTMVPLRAISESFGPRVDYIASGCADGKNQVIITLGDTIIHHCIGTPTLDISIEGSVPKILTFDTASEIMNDRTFVPIRFIAEAFDAEVGWLAESKTVTITYQP